MRIAAIVMASGLSRRMGKDKLMMPYKDRPLLSYVLEAVRDAMLDGPKIVVAVSVDVMQLAETYGFTSVLNRANMTGQSASIHAGVTAAGEVDQYMFFAGDMPLITPALIHSLVDRADKRRIIVASHKGEENLPTIFPAMYREQLLQTHGDHGGKMIKQANHGNIIRVEAGEQAMFDVDSRADYDKLQKM